MLVKLTILHLPRLQQLSAQIISNDTIDFGYPSIAYMGNNSFDHRAMITCSHSTTNTFPGTVAFYKDAQGNISDPLIIKSGESAVEYLARQRGALGRLHRHTAKI
jgi:hypothetical protein